MDGFWTEELTDTRKEAKTWEETIGRKTICGGRNKAGSFDSAKSGNLTIPSLEIEAIYGTKPATL